jgi:coenzyme F420-reducing hydrogenase delta subunit/Pyruvate/2-oxoacid:ferredoxin oxidoreductase delta subunit
MSNGRRAAAAIHSYLSTGKVAPLPPDPFQAVGELSSDTVSKVKKKDRTKMPMVPPAERVKNFDVIELGYSEEQAISEAQRCLLCAVGAQRNVVTCPDCLTCVRVCPYDVPVATEEGVKIRLDQCQSCGICATRCPGGFINLKHFSREEIMARVQAALADAKSTPETSVLLGFVCRYGSGTNGMNGELPAKLRTDGIRIVELPCTGRIDISHVLAAFEQGADGVFITGCSKEDCHFLEGSSYSKGVVTRAKSLLDGTGLGGGRVEFVNLASHEAEELLNKAQEVREKLAALGSSPLRKQAARA